MYFVLHRHHLYLVHNYLKEHLQTHLQQKYFLNQLFCKYCFRWGLFSKNIRRYQRYFLIKIYLFFFRNNLIRRSRLKFCRRCFCTDVWNVFFFETLFLYFDFEDRFGCCIGIELLFSRTASCSKDDLGFNFSFVLLTLTSFDSIVSLF